MKILMDVYDNDSDRRKAALEKMTFDKLTGRVLRVVVECVGEKDDV